MQSVNLSTSIGILVTVEIVTGFFVSLPVSSCPSVGVVSGFCVSLVLRVVNGQVEGIGAFAAVSVVVVVGVVAAGGVGCAVPQVAFAGHRRFGIVCALVDGQMERDSGVRAVLVGISPLIITRSGVGPSIPIVGFASSG